MRIGPIVLFADGTPYDERAPEAAAYLQGKDIDVEVDLGTGGRGAVADVDVRSERGIRSNQRDD